MKAFSGLFLVLFYLVAVSAPVLAQTGNASIDGTITDISGAVIPHALVTVTNNATGVAKTVEVTTSGLYVLSPLISGVYTIEAKASGFKTEIVKGVQLVIDQEARVDMQLQVGAANQQVTVNADAAILQADEASVGYVVQSRQVTDLPLNGRYFTQLLELSPGTNFTGFQRNQMPFFNVNGLDGNMIFFRLDGVENNEREFGGANIPVSVDSIQEVKVQTANFSAEYGRSPIQVDVAVKSGTNQIHGSVFEFLRNDDLDATVWSFTGPHAKNLLKRNQFGGAAGGPIKKDKLFYFGSFDGTRERFSQPSTMTVPSDAERQGIFPAGTIIFDPLSQAPFANNTIPASRFNGIDQKVLPFLPAQNLAGVPNTNSLGLPLAPSNNYYYDPFRNQNINQYTGRVDYNRSEKDSFFGRYTYSSNFRIGQGPLATNVQSALNGVENANIGGQNVSGSWNRVISAHTINEFRAGLSTDPQNYAKADNSDYASQFGIKSFLYPNAYPGFPHFIIGSLNLGSGDYRPLKVGEKNFQASDNITLVRGTHNLRIGGDFRYTILNTTNNQLSTGKFTFSGVETRDRARPTVATTACPGSASVTSCGAGDAMADFLLGFLSNAVDGTPIPPISKYFSNWAGYVNDTWNFSRKLTFTLGLRYEYQTRFHTDPYFYTQPLLSNYEFNGKIGLATGSDGNLPSGISQVALAQAPGAAVSCKSAGLPDTCLISEKNHWQPRFGVAYRLDQKTVIRSGAGIFYGSFYGDNDTESCQSWPLVLTQSTTNYTSAPTGNAPPPISINNPFSGANPALPTYANCATPNRRVPVSYQWNFTVERAIGSNNTLTASYVGNGTRHLDQGSAGGQNKQVTYNVLSPWGVVLAPGQTQKRAQPLFGNVGQYQDNDSSNYNALQVKDEFRFKYGLSFTASYSWSKSITVQKWLGDPRFPFLDRGPSNINVPQAFTVSPIYTLPVGQGERFLNHNRILDVLAGGWRLSGILNYRAGLPFTPVLSGLDELNLGGLNGQNRPDRVCNGAISSPTVFQWYNSSCFTVPVEPTTPGALLHEGTSGVNILSGPRWFSFDSGISKTFHLTERIGLDFRAEMFNAFNHPILGQPATSLNLFSTATPQTRITNTAGNTFPRIIQFAMKLRF